MFEHVKPYAGDPIFALVDAYNADPRPQKVNLSIGIYFDEQGRLPVLDSVRGAEAKILAAGGPKPYLPMEGEPAMRREVQKLLLGADHPAIAEGRVATIQSVGSSGGLKVGADFLKTWLPDSCVWVSDPTWDNHRSMFEGSGFTVQSYPYYDAQTGGVRFDDMLAALRALPARSIVLLHACCLHSCHLPADELLFEVDAQDAVLGADGQLEAPGRQFLQVAAAVKQIMEGAAPLNVPLRVKLAWGQSWGSLTALEL